MRSEADSCSLRGELRPSLTPMRKGLTGPGFQSCKRGEDFTGSLPSGDLGDGITGSDAAPGISLDRAVFGRVMGIESARARLKVEVERIDELRPIASK